MAFVGTLPAAFLWPCFCRRREQQESLRWAKTWLIILPQHSAIPPWSCDRTRVHHQQTLCRKPTSPQDEERCCGPTWLHQGYVILPTSRIHLQTAPCHLPPTHEMMELLRFNTRDANSSGRLSRSWTTQSPQNNIRGKKEKKRKWKKYFIGDQPKKKSTREEDICSQTWVKLATMIERNIS